jgi:hypothetical protein
MHAEWWASRAALLWGTDDVWCCAGYRPVMEKITFGDNIPGYIYGPEDAPGVVMLQAS